MVGSRSEAVILEVAMVDQEVSLVEGRRAFLAEAVSRVVEAASRAVAARLVDLGDLVDLMEEAADPREAPDPLAEGDIRREAEDLGDPQELAVDHLDRLVTQMGRAAP